MSVGKRRRAGTVPLVLLVGCPADFVTVCGETGGRLAVDIKECDLDAARAVDATTRPFVIGVTEERYARSPSEIDALARRLEAPLMRFDVESVRRCNGQRLLAEAVLESAAANDGSGAQPSIC